MTLAQKRKLNKALRRLAQLAPQQHREYVQRLEARAEKVIAAGDVMAWDAIRREVEVRLADAVSASRMQAIFELIGMVIGAAGVEGADVGLAVEVLDRVATIAEG